VKRAALVDSGLHRRILWSLGAALAAGAVGLLLLATPVMKILRDVTANEMAATPDASTRQTVAIDGDPARFDPVTAFDQVMSLAGSGARLEQLRSTRVRRDGTIDLTADYFPAPSATYDLHRDAAAPKTAPPVGGGGSADGRWYQPLRAEASKPGRRRQVTRIGGGSAQRYWYVSRGLDLDAGDVTGKPSQRPVPPPACTFARLWDAAIAQGAPDDAVAQIRYDARGYDFNIPGVFNRRFDMDCVAARRR
jgi:hypothetical protein